MIGKLWKRFKDWWTYSELKEYRCGCTINVEEDRWVIQCYKHGCTCEHGPGLHDDRCCGDNFRCQCKAFGPYGIPRSY